MEKEKSGTPKEVDIETASIVSQVLREILDSSTNQSEPSTSNYRPCIESSDISITSRYSQPTCSNVQGDTFIRSRNVVECKRVIEEAPPYKTCTVKDILTEILDCTVICRPQLQLPPPSDRCDRTFLECNSPPPEYMLNPVLLPRQIYNNRTSSDESTSSRMQYTVKEVFSEIMDYTVFKKTDRQTNIHDYSRPSTSTSGQLGQEGNRRDYEIYRTIGAGIVNSTNAIHDEAYLKKTPVTVHRMLPSYSTVLRMGPAPKINPIGSSGSFVPRKPPPSYAEVEGIWEDSPSLISSESAVFGPDPTYMICPRCRTAVVTDVQVHRSIVTHLIAIFLCLCLCWPCCLMPYCLRSCNYLHHTCPHCSYYFGMYRPF